MFRYSQSLVVLSLVALTAASAARGAGVLDKTTKGRPDLKSIDVISFAPDGVLLVGDGRGSQVLAIQTGDTSAGTSQNKALAGIDKQIAARLGTRPSGIEIIDLAVNPASGKIYIAVRKQDDKSYAVLTVADGEIGGLELDGVTYARVKVSAGKGTISKITDVAWADSQIVAAGRSNEEFSSKIFSIDVPVSHDAAGNSFSAETYHVSHGRWETKAPMSVLIPLKEDDRMYVVGAFSCTPVVKYPLTSVQPGSTIKGSSMIELGSGNRPLDMFVYQKDGRPYVLANTFRFHHSRKPFGPSPYWTVKFEQGLLVDADKVNENATRRLGAGYKPITSQITMVDAYHGVMQMDRLNATHAIVLRETEGGLSLEPLALP